MIYSTFKSYTLQLNAIVQRGSEFSSESSLLLVQNSLDCAREREREKERERERESRIERVSE